jgi:small-conductance mechanosensitive channel
MTNWAEALSMRLPDQVDLAALGAAATIVTVSVLMGLVAAKWLGRPIAARLAPGEGENRTDHERAACFAAGSLVFWAVLAIALRSYAWPPIALIVLSVAAASAGALFAIAFGKIVDLSRSLAILLAVGTFAIVLANGLGGLNELRRVLGGIGFDFGTWRFSLLWGVEFAIIVAALYAVVRFGNRLVATAARRAGLEVGQQLLLRKLAAVALVAMAFLIGVELAGFDLTALTIFGGALALAIGFGLQKILGNLFSGIVLLMDRSVKPGDVIVVADTFGTVHKMGARATSIVTRDGKKHLIPNESLVSRRVENWSYSSRNVRIRIPVRVAPDCDIHRAQQLMVEAAASAERVLSQPAPRVLLRRLDERGAHHEIRAWVADPEAGVWGVESEILNRLWLSFKENGIAIPFEQRDYRIKSVA